MERALFNSKIRYCLWGVFLLFLGGYSDLPEPGLAAVSKTAPAKKFPVPPHPSVSEVYLSQVGVREKTGHNDGAEVEKYLASVNTKKGNSWCAAFVHWCLEQARVPNKVNAWSPSAQNPKHVIFRDRQFLEEPRPGDVGCLYYTRLGRIGHTFFYHERVNRAVYKSVEGNTNDAGSRDGDGVYMKYRSFNSTYSISRWE